MSDGSCIDGCKDGWSGQYCGNKCFPNCQQCRQFNTSVCDACNNGFYGNSCSKSCSSQCKLSDGNLTCDNSNGNCIHGCKEGYWGNTCGNKCSDGCYSSDCNGTFGDCLSGCMKGFYGKRCDMKCSITCANGTCNASNGLCSDGCLPGSSGVYCDKSCPPNCQRCDQLNSTFCNSCHIGFYGDSCNQSCNRHCKMSIGNQTCSKIDGICHYGCDDGYWSDDCSSVCSKGCNGSVCNRTSGECLTGCTDNFYGRQCKNKCNFNCTEGKCNPNDGSCSDGCEPGWSGQYCNNTCARSCYECNQFNASVCDSCGIGYYGETCNQNCSVHCKLFDRNQTCYKDIGTCIYGCEDGYWGKDCGKTCPPECNNSLCNITSGDCLDGCNEGFHGYHCTKQCGSNCANRKCNRLDGLCSDGCKLGWSGLNCTESCLSYCQECDQHNSSFCTVCDIGIYGDKCNQSCSIHCIKTNGTQTCEKSDGKCNFGCEDGYAGGNCNKTCPQGCISCEQYNSLFCNSCRIGYYGDSCNYNCSIRCTLSEGNQTCRKHDGTCIHGCNDGYWGMKCNNTCSNGCNRTACNSDTGDCLYGCIKGFYGNHCETKCGSNCKNETCNEENGQCTKGCELGWSGKTCDGNCPSNCQECEQFNNSFCRSCHVGYYGDSCNQNCSTHCFLSAGQQICYKNGGTCIYGCENAYWGNSCDNICSVGCEDSVCNSTSGDCLKGCLETFYGSRCDVNCSLNCLKVVGTSRECDENSGDCITGCIAGWYGSNCTMECNTSCKDSECFQHNGTCLRASTEDSAPTSPSKEEDSIVIPIAAGAGAAFVVALVIIIFVLCRRKRRNPKGTLLDEKNRSGELKLEENAFVANPIFNIDDSSDLSKPAGILRKNSSDEKSKSVVTFQTELDGTNHQRSLPKENEYKQAKISQNDTTDNSVKQNGQNDNKDVRSTVTFAKDLLDGDLDLQEDSEERQAQDTAKNIDLTTSFTPIQVPVSNLADYVKKKDQNELKAEFNQLPSDLQKAHKAAKTNDAKNRYRLIYPYDECRVILTDGGDEYVNASYIDGFNRPREYIAASGPYRRPKGHIDTVPDFWRMVWQESCATIVMLTKCYENGEYKCEPYWPELSGNEQYGNTKVACVTEDQYADFIIRTFLLTKGGATLRTRHLQFTAWPDKGVPADVTSMIDFQHKVRSLHKKTPSPIIVHCSAGIGRTGTFIALDQLIFCGKLKAYVDIYSCVENLRSQRVNMVQTQEQYDYLHRAVLHALTFDCESITAEKFAETYDELIKNEDDKTRIESQFKDLQSVLDEISTEEKVAIFQNTTYTDKNREHADIPGDEKRVRLYENRRPDDSDYINAVYFNGFRSPNKFICAQTPLPSTIADFLTMIFQVNCSSIVMMDEIDAQDQTVGVFCPTDEQVVEQDEFQVRCKESKKTQIYTQQKLLIKRHGEQKDEEREVDLFTYTDWPRDANVPRSPESLLQLIKDVGNNAQVDDIRPILVNCMTGAERSCLFCAVSVLIEKIEIEHEISVVNTLMAIKARRRSAIPTMDQYKFCHQAVISYLQQFDNSSNFGLKASISKEHNPLPSFSV